MPKLAPVSRRKFIQRLRELGFEGPFSGGKHPQMKRGDLTFIIPNEHEGDIGPGFLSRLLRQAGVSREEWLGEK
jgi:predicted RNA binding protein YcfA (HicA-like mRNA interferase family)